MQSNQINVLYLDDEAHNLQSFKASFRRKYNIFTATTVQEADNIIDSIKIHVVLADQRMPEMTGAQFFEKLLQRNPDPIRILITGHTDISAAIDAINKGEVLRFVDKPWDHSYVERAIDHGYEIYRNKEDLAHRNAELQKAYEELDKFVYSASHDLRAPLMSVMGLVNVALADEAESHSSYLEMIKQSVVRLDSFILDIIDYYKNARGVPVIEAIDFESVVNEVKETIKYIPGFEKIEHNITINQAGVFKSDAMKIRIILNNLLTNAVKFRDPKKELPSFCLQIKADEQEAEIVMADNGVGIKEKDLQNIFKMFYRGSGATIGSGIGLYIVHEAISKLMGTISVNSVYGDGARFNITLPSIND